MVFWLYEWNIRSPLLWNREQHVWWWIKLEMMVLLWMAGSFSLSTGIFLWQAWFSKTIQCWSCFLNHFYCSYMLFLGGNEDVITSDKIKNEIKMWLFVACLMHILCICFCMLICIYSEESFNPWMNRGVQRIISDAPIYYFACDCISISIKNMSFWSYSFVCLFVCFFFNLLIK